MTTPCEFSLCCNHRARFFLSIVTMMMDVKSRENQEERALIMVRLSVELLSKKSGLSEKVAFVC
jgi:hypothetical protein